MAHITHFAAIREQPIELAVDFPAAPSLGTVQGGRNCHFPHQGKFRLSPNEAVA
jgi:hypothetical protein